APTSPEAYYMNYGHLLSFDYLFSWRTVNIIFRNLLFIPVAVGGLLCFPLSFLSIPRAWAVAPGWPAFLLLSALLLIGLGGLVWVVGRSGRPRLLHYYVLAYVALILVTPFPDIRYWIPVFPFLLILGYQWLAAARPAWLAFGDGGRLTWRPSLLIGTFI